MYIYVYIYIYMIDMINIEKPNNSFILPFLCFICYFCYLEIHLLQMKLKTRSPKYNKYNMFVVKS